MDACNTTNRTSVALAVPAAGAVHSAPRRRLERLLQARVLPLGGPFAKPCWVFIPATVMRTKRPKFLLQPKPLFQGSLRRNPQTKKLTNFAPEYRLRVGKYRGVSEVDHGTATVYRVLHRKDAYS
jgi:mRNA-degrading endonuclease RelE of RelBE toxin-antitoxin system